MKPVSGASHSSLWLTILFNLKKIFSWFFCRRDPMVNLNYAVFLHNAGDKQGAAKQFSVFEQKFQQLKSSSPNEIDQEVNYPGRAITQK